MSDLEHEKDKLKHIIKGIEQYQDNLLAILQKIKDELPKYVSPDGSIIYNDLIHSSFDYGLNSIAGLLSKVEGDFSDRLTDLRYDGLADKETESVFEDIKTLIRKSFNEINDKYGTDTVKNRETLSDRDNAIISKLEDYCEDELSIMDNEHFIKDRDIDVADLLAVFVNDLQETVKKAYKEYTVEEILMCFR